MSKWVDRQRKEREDAERLLRETAPKVPTCSTSPTEWNFEAAGYVGQEAAEKASKLGRTPADSADDRLPSRP